MTIAALKEYLGMVVQTEKEVDAQKELSSRLALDIRHYHTQIDALNHSMQTMEKPDNKPVRKKDNLEISVAGLVGCAICVIVTIIAYYYFANGHETPLMFVLMYLLLPIGGLAALYGIMTLFSLPSVFSKDERAYEWSMKVYEDQCRQYNEIQKENKNRKNQIQKLTTQIAVAEAYRQQVETSLRSSRANLEKMYSYNVVFPKYRNYVMVSSIYEYLCSGRCTTLEGHDGAYNILELEIRLDKIITRLDDILKNLEAIRANQYTLYSCLQDSNRKIGTLLQEETRIAEGMQKLGTQGYEMNQRLGELQRSSELSNYLAECNQQELHYMNRMNYLAGNYDNPYGNYAPV